MKYLYWFNILLLKKGGGKVELSWFNRAAACVIAADDFMPFMLTDTEQSNWGSITNQRTLPWGRLLVSCSLHSQIPSSSVPRVEASRCHVNMSAVLILAWLMFRWPCRWDSYSSQVGLLTWPGDTFSQQTPCSLTTFLPPSPETTPQPWVRRTCCEYISWNLSSTNGQHRCSSNIIPMEQLS